MRQEMRYTAGQAAKATGKSIPTITRAIKKGTISAERTSSGGYLIDPAELHRVFPFQAPDRSADRFPEPQPTTLGNHPTTTIDRGLEREVELLREMLAKAEANADHWRTLAERQQALLEDKRLKKPRSLLQRILGR